VNAGASLTAVIVTFVVWFVHSGVAAASHARSVNEQLPCGTGPDGVKVNVPPVQLPPVQVFAVIVTVTGAGPSGSVVAGV
jgi:hypothetical protein